MTALEKKELENKILTALKEHAEWMDEYDANRKAEYDEDMEMAEIQTSECWKKHYQESAEWALHFQKHGYDFIDGWKNVIAKAWYGRIYQQWHSAQAGRYKGQGHSSYITSELTTDEQNNVNEVFNRIVNRGILKKSKSGKMATLTKNYR